jgi:hypothetical protein
MKPENFRAIYIAYGSLTYVEPKYLAAQKV